MGTLHIDKQGITMKRMNLFAAILFAFTFLFFQPLSIVYSQSAPDVKRVLITRGLTAPVGMAFPPDGSNRIFIIEQAGKIRILKNGILLPKPFLNISAKLDKLNKSYSEKGLLGLAFHPGYQSNGKFYVYYSAPADGSGVDHKSILAEYKVSAGNPDSAASGEYVIMEILQPESNHNGGCLAFGKDNYLYIGLGDGGGAGDKHGSTGNGQNLNTLLGKILRIDVNGRKPYSIPPDNPFVNKSGARPEIYAYGLRNPWRFSFDRKSGLLFCADVGQDKWEEIDIIEKGKNYGWNIMEGDHCFKPRERCNMIGLTLPITEYSHDEGVSICGGYVYRGNANPQWNGIYFFGDWSGKLFSLTQNSGGGWSRRVLKEDASTTEIKINSMGEDEKGEIYLITQDEIGPYSNTGALYLLSR